MRRVWSGQTNWTHVQLWWPYDWCDFGLHGVPWGMSLQGQMKRRGHITLSETVGGHTPMRGHTPRTKPPTSQAPFFSVLVGTKPTRPPDHNRPTYGSIEGSYDLDGVCPGCGRSPSKTYVCANRIDVDYSNRLKSGMAQLYSVDQWIKVAHWPAPLDPISRLPTPRPRRTPTPRSRRPTYGRWSGRDARARVTDTHPNLTDLAVNQPAAVHVLCAARTW